MILYGGITKAQTPTWQWAKQYFDNSISLDRTYGLNSIGADSSGNTYILGSFTNSLTFGTITINKSGTDSKNIFLAKFNNLGTCLWAITYNGARSNLQLSVDKSGNSYITNNEGNGYCNLLKYDSNGIFKWIISGGGGTDIPNGYGTGAMSAYSVSTDNNGNAYICGYFIKV